MIVIVNDPSNKYFPLRKQSKKQERLQLKPSRRFQKRHSKIHQKRDKTHKGIVKEKTMPPGCNSNTLFTETHKSYRKITETKPTKSL